MDPMLNAPVHWEVMCACRLHAGQARMAPGCVTLPCTLEPFMYGRSGSLEDLLCCRFADVTRIQEPTQPSLTLTEDLRLWAASWENDMSRMRQQ